MFVYAFDFMQVMIINKKIFHSSVENESKSCDGKKIIREYSVERNKNQMNSEIITMDLYYGHY